MLTPLKKTHKIYSYPVLLEKLKRYCAERERCLKDVENFIGRFLDRQTDRDRMIAELKKEGFLNEERFVANYVDSHIFRLGWGKEKIKAALSEKEILPQIIDNVLDNVDERNYLHFLASMMYKKRKTLAGPLRDRKLKAAHFAISKGFEPSLVERLLAQSADLSNE